MTRGVFRSWVYPLFFFKLAAWRRTYSFSFIATSIYRHHVIARVSTLVACPRRSPGWAPHSHWEIPALREAPLGMTRGVIWSWVYSLFFKLTALEKRPKLQLA
jgi:hypothetical protein